jgi:protein phosphatase
MASSDLTTTDPAAWRVAYQTDTGRVRPHNEDTCGTFQNASGARLFVVADGMGGHRGGATASKLAVDSLGAALERAGDVSAAWFASAIRAANGEVHARAEREAELRGMGTTLVAVLVAPNGRAWVGHVGDSRAYRLRDAALEPLTDDHSVVAEMIRRGLLTPDEAAIHPRRNEILRSVGVEAEVEPEVRELALLPGDRLLLCSDGLCGVVPDDELEQLLRADTPDESVALAIAAANESGGPDNITAVIAEVPALPGAAAAAGRGEGSTVALALLAALVVALGAFAFKLWS